MKTAALTKRWGCRFEVGLCLSRAQRLTLESLAFTDQRVTASALKGLAEQVSATRIENDIRGLADLELATLCLKPSQIQEALARPSLVRSSWRCDGPHAKNIVIDNYLFGVSSMNKDGIGSPFVFPGPIGSVRYD